MIDEAVLDFSAGSLTLLNAILAVVMFSIAIDLKPRDFKALATAPKPLVVGLLSQFVLLPILTFLMVIALRPQASVALGLILVAACPGGNISNFITHRAGGNAALSVSMTAFATVGAILLTPFNIAFWGSLYEPSAEILRQTHIDPVSIAITVGLMLVPHGWMKLIGAGLEGTARLMAQIGLEPAYPLAVYIALLELVGGVLLALGLFTRPIAVLLVGFMTVSAYYVHAANGFLWIKGGFEYPLFWGLVALAIAFRGGGPKFAGRPHEAQILGGVGEGSGLHAGIRRTGGLQGDSDQKNRRRC